MEDKYMLVECFLNDEHYEYVCDNNEFVGLVYTISIKKLTYVFFLAVKEGRTILGLRNKFEPKFDSSYLLTYIA